MILYYVVLSGLIFMQTSKITSERKDIKEKESRNFFYNFFRKSLVLFVVSFAFLLFVWLREDATSSLNILSFFVWLVEHGIAALPWPSDMNVVNLFFCLVGYFFVLFIICIVIACLLCLKRVWHFWKRNDGIEGEKKCAKSLWNRIKACVKSLWNDIGKHKAKYGTKLRKILIWLTCLSWLMYAFFSNAGVCIKYNVFLGENFPDVETLVSASLWAGFVFVCFLLLLELAFVSGWDYFRFGRSGFYKGGKHWYEEEKKYLGAGDYSFIGKKWFNFLHSLFLLGLDSHCAFLSVVLKKTFNLRYKAAQFWYQLYILFRYNSLLHRIIYWAIIVFVGVNIWQIKGGAVPSWSLWWTDDTWMGNFIKSSTVLRTYLNCPLNNLSFLILFGLIVEKRDRKKYIDNFLYGRLNVIVVVASTIVAVLLVLSNVAKKDFMASLLFFDALFTLIFLIEIALKIYEAGSKFFFREGVETHISWANLDKWNILDMVVVIASITSIFMLKDEYQLLSGMYAMIILRIVRLLKLVRLLRIFKKYLVDLWEGAKHAMIKSIPIIIVFGILLFFVGFGFYWASDHFGIGREFFNDPITSVFSLFRLFTYDGWHDIPVKIAEECSKKDIWQGVWWIETAVRIGFCALVFAGGIVGVALLNSVFVDGMMLRDKSEADRVHRLNELDRKIEEISTKLDDMEKRRIQS